MARSWLFLCLWAVVLLVFVEQCHAVDAEGTIEPACTEDKKEKCTKMGATCQEPLGDCKCEAGKQIVDGSCKEPACTEDKKEKCTKMGATCQEPLGDCKCEAGNQIIDGSCKEEPSSTTEAATMQSSQTPDVTTDCSQKIVDCQKDKKTSCKVINGTATCVCPPTMRENENGDCFLAKKVTVTFQLKPRKKRSTTYSAEPTCNENITELIREIMKEVPNAIEESIVCNGNSVSFDVFAENADEEEKIKYEIFKNCKGDDCNLGTVIPFERQSADVTATDMCKEEETQKLAEKMGMICKYDNTTRMFCNKDKTTAIGKADLQGIPFEICKALPCSRTCTNNKMHCVLESCVCKPQYKLQDGECKSVCELNPSVCPSGATCVPGMGDQSFYCECPPKLTGPLCQRENKPLQTAKLNIVVVGVVLASLLLLCFVVSASIISRLRKKAQGPSFSKDCERRPQRELRGYDGPYKASDPASLHRGRDHTSL